MNFKTRIGRLDNGVKYILSDNPSTQSVVILISIRYGSGFDKIGKSGMAHLLEHLIFKGTKRRPFTKEIMIELNSIGSEYNAYTSKIFTGYHAKSAYMYLENIMDILSDILKNPKFLFLDSKEFLEEFEQEKKIVLQELFSIRDNYARYLTEMTENNVYISPLNRSSEDDIHDIESITLQDVIETYNKYYCSENIIVSIHGNLSQSSNSSNYNFSNTIKLVNKYFGDIKSNEPNKLLFTKKKDINTINKIDILKKPNISKCHVSLSYLTTGFSNKLEYYMNELLGLIFVDLTSSRLFQHIREEKGLIYNIHSNHFCYDKVGCFDIQTNTNESNLESVLEELKKEIDILKSKGLTEKEYQIAIKNYTTKILLDSEYPMTIAKYNAYELFYNPDNFTSYFENIDIIKSISRDNINTYIREFLNPTPIITLIKSE